MQHKCYVERPCGCVLWWDGKRCGTDYCQRHGTRQLPLFTESAS